jgi:thiamine pyrophosphokinase
MTFSLSVKAIGDSAAQLTALALNGTRFDIILQETDQSNDWSFTKIVMQECIITSASPTNAVISGAPTATFSGFSLAAQAQPKIGPSVSIP